MKIQVKDETFELDFKVEDRLTLAGIMSKGSNLDKLSGLNEFCVDIMKRAYPSESEEDIKSYLSTHIDAFLEEVLVGCGLTTHEQIKAEIDAAKKKIGE